MSPLRIGLFLLALGVLAAFVQVGLVSIAFEKLGLSQHSAYLLLITTLAGSLVNLPLFSIAAEAPPPEQAYKPLRELWGFPRIEFTGRTIVAVNAGGCVTPVAFSLYLMAHNPVTLPQVLLAVVIVSAVAYLTSYPIPRVGIGIPILVAPLAAALVAALINPEERAVIAYIGGTLGVLIGADILRLKSIRKLGAPLASIGGAGTFDGIFLSGLVAVLLA
jgi:uncharacterized membrane protein